MLVLAVPWNEKNPVQIVPRIQLELRRTRIVRSMDIANSSAP